MDEMQKVKKLNTVYLQVMRVYTNNINNTNNEDLEGFQY